MINWSKQKSVPTALLPLAQVAQRALASVIGLAFVAPSGIWSQGHLRATSTTKPTISGVNGGITGTPTVVGSDAGGIITFIVGGGNIAALTNLFTLTFATAYEAQPAVVLCFMDTTLYGGAGLGTTGVTAAKFAVVNGDLLGLGNTFHVAYHVLGVQ